MSTTLTDSEIDDICAGLKQSHAKIRYLKSLGIHALRKPNGAPLVSRNQYDAVMLGTVRSGGQPSIGSGPVWGVH